MRTLAACKYCSWRLCLAGLRRETPLSLGTPPFAAGGGESAQLCIPPAPQGSRRSCRQYPPPSELAMTPPCLTHSPPPCLPLVNGLYKALPHLGPLNAMGKQLGIPGDSFGRESSRGSSGGWAQGVAGLLKPFFFRRRKTLLGCSHPCASAECLHLRSRATGLPQAALGCLPHHHSHAFPGQVVEEQAA